MRLAFKYRQIYFHMEKTKKRQIADTLFAVFPFPFGLGKVAKFDRFPVPSSDVKEDGLNPAVVCLLEDSILAMADAELPEVTILDVDGVEFPDLKYPSSTCDKLADEPLFCF